MFCCNEFFGCLDFVCSGVLAAVVDLIASARNRCSIVATKCSLTLLIAATAALSNHQHIELQFILGTILKANSAIDAFPRKLGP